MATGNETSAIPGDLTEVRILNGLFTGPFNEYESLVDAWQEDIDTRIMKQQSLLHVAVTLGKVDWVEGLLLRGADTDLQDEGQASALTAAEEMLRKYPDDGFRVEVLRLVRLVNKTAKAKKMRGIRGIPSRVKPKEQNFNLIKAMMRKTVILNCNERKEASVRSVYMRLHDEHKIATSILKFLTKQPEFKAIVDCDSEDIYIIVPKFLQSKMFNKSDKFSFADFQDSIVYLGGKMAQGRGLEEIAYSFARSLTQMAMFLAFRNEGRPYKCKDEKARLAFNSAYAQAKAMMEGRDCLHSTIVTALTSHKEFASIVPMIIAYLGSSAVDSVLQKQVPLLLEFFKNHVIRSLMD